MGSGGSTFFSILHLSFMGAFLAHWTPRSASELRALAAHRGTIVGIGAPLMVAILFGWAITPPEDPVVSSVYFMVCGLGIIAILVRVGVFDAMRWAAWGESRSLFDILRSFVSGLALYSVIMWVIGRFGDAVKQAVEANPEEAVAMLVVAFVVFLIFRASGEGRHFPAEPEGYRAVALGRPSQSDRMEG